MSVFFKPGHHKGFTTTLQQILVMSEWHPVAVISTSKNIENLTHLLMSFQLIVGCLTVVGIGLASRGLSKPMMKQGPVSRQHSPSADSEKAVILILLFWDSPGMFRQENSIKSLVQTRVVFHQVMQGGESESWRYIDPAILEARNAVVLYTIQVWGVGPPQDR